eukprot:4576304-Prymnesium_polylepis.1
MRPCDCERRSVQSRRDGAIGIRVWRSPALISGFEGEIEPARCARGCTCAGRASLRAPPPLFSESSV